MPPPPSLAIAVSDSLLIILVPLVCLFGGYLSTVAAMGGGIMIVAVCTLLLPLSAVVPLTSVFVMSGQIARVSQFWRHIDWQITRPFIPGSLLGAALGTWIYLSLPETAVALLLATMMLWFAWVPSSASSRSLARRIPQPWFWVGIVHTFLSSVSGVGGLFQALMVNSPLKKEGIVATVAGTLLFMSLFKTVGYVAAGFDYRPYLSVIVLSWLAATLGSWWGRHSLNRISDRLFRQLIRAMITLFSLRLYWSAAADFFS